MLELRANTAVDVLIGPFVDDTDGKTAETALTISQADVKLSKNGQALTQKNDDTAAAHDANGYYNCELDATDTNTEGTLVLVVSESGALPVRHEFAVLSEAAWDSKYLAKDDGFMDVNMKAISDDTTAADNCELMFDGTGYAGGTTKLAVSATNGSGEALATATAVAALPTAATIGTPVALDGGTASLAGMLAKLADDNGGADFDAALDSLRAQRRPMRTSVSVNVAQLRERLETGARVVFCDRSFFNDSGFNVRTGFLRQLKRPNAGMAVSAAAGAAPNREAWYANFFAPTNCTNSTKNPNEASGLADLTNGFVNQTRYEWVWTENGAAPENIYIGRIDPAASGTNGCTGWHDISWMDNGDVKARLFYIRSANGITVDVIGWGTATVSPSPTVVDTSTGNNAVGQLCWVDIPLTISNPAAAFGINLRTRAGAEPTAGKGLVFAGVRVWSPTQTAYAVETANMAWGGSTVVDALNTAYMSDANMALYARANQIDTVVIWYVDDAVAATYAANHVLLAQRWTTAINAARAIDPTIRPPVVCFIPTPENSTAATATYPAALKAAALANGYSCVDLFSLMQRKHGPVASWSATYTSDGLHPLIPTGQDEYAKLVCDEVFESVAVPTLDVAVDTLPTAAENGAATWNALTANHIATGSFGKLVGTTWAAVFSGITSLANWLRALTRSSTPDATALTEINDSGGTYAVATDSLQAGGTTRAAIAAKTGSIGVGRVPLVSPVGAEGDITVLLHGRYRSAAGAANTISTEVSSANAPSSVTNGATATLRVVDTTDDTLVVDDVPVTVSGVGGGTITYTVSDLDLENFAELEADETGRFRFSVLNDADHAPLWFGKFLIRPGPPR